VPKYAGQQRTLVHFKWCKWWLQSWLAGVPTIVAGERTEDGQLVNVSGALFVRFRTCLSMSARQGTCMLLNQGQPPWYTVQPAVGVARRPEPAKASAVEGGNLGRLADAAVWR
jgi:hypothetical protein